LIWIKDARRRHLVEKDRRVFGEQFPADRRADTLTQINGIKLNLTAYQMGIGQRLSVLR
jgi:hypothetical protein